MYTINIKDYATNEVIDNGSFEDKKTANKFKKEMMEKHSLRNYAGHVVNFNTNKELFTNY